VGVRRFSPDDVVRAQGGAGGIVKFSPAGCRICETGLSSTTLEEFMENAAALPPEPDDQRRSARKRRAILDAAATVFLGNGYLGTSMDEIAAHAGVSKQTVYKHFADKGALFVEIVTGAVDEIADPVHDEVLRLRDTGDLQADLRDLARRQLERVMQPRLLALRRLVIAEAGRFPELGCTFYERGAGRTIAVLASTFERLAERGILALEDPELAAAHFNWLVMSAPINQAMLLGPDKSPAPAQLERYADGGVRAFLAAYGGGRPSQTS
jgi:TetR/AcrR family transcriptional regulator, mexJK operon transcriptional repressor